MLLIQNKPIYQVSSEKESPEPNLTGKDLVLAWARDIVTKEPRHIGELRKDQTGQKCGCECYSCNLPLEAVNAGKTEFHIRPHFRHPDGAPKGECLVLAARAAALELLLKEGELILPRRRKTEKAEGLSGEFYEAWVDAPRERIRIADYKLEDRANALLTLDDGRLLRVTLVGSVETSQDDDDTLEVTPTIRLIVDDPSIAGMPPEELRKRITLIIDDGRWCSHWSDAELAAQALAEATQQAEDSLDWLDLPDGASNDLKRETLLHLKAKEILEQEKQIYLPILSVSSKQELPKCQPIERRSSRPEQLVKLANVRLEQHLGEIKPDVLASTIESSAWPADTLSIEITVTNGIDEERLERIRQKGIPTLEIDVSRMGGKVTLEEFKRLIVLEVAAKRWVYHPWQDSEKAKLDVVVQQEAATAMAEQEEKEKRDKQERELMKLHLSELARRYIDAVIDHAQLRAHLPDSATEEEKARLAAAVDRIHDLASIFAKRGFPEADDEFLYLDRGNLLERLLSIRFNKCIGYRMETAWQVINAILQENQGYARWQWHPLYLMAIKTYPPTLNSTQDDHIQKWRERVWKSLNEGKMEYRPSERYNRLLCLLFPEMSAKINARLPGNPGDEEGEGPTSSQFRPDKTISWKNAHTNWYSSFIKRRKDHRWKEIIEIGHRLRNGPSDAQDGVEECANYFSFQPSLIIVAWSEANIINQDTVLKGAALEVWERRHPEAARKWFGE
jgi:hypothetical protein